VRLSIGLEAESDLIEDLERALEATVADIHYVAENSTATVAAFWPAPHHG
jgi:hypothetical protein